MNASSFLEKNLDLFLWKKKNLFDSFKGIQICFCIGKKQLVL